MIALIAVSGDADEVESARLALDALTRGLPFFAGRRVQTWVAPTGDAGAAWIRSAGSHAVEESIAASGSRAAFVLGRPIRWIDDRADGVGVLDAERMAAVPPNRLAAELDGRGLLVRVDADGISVVGDPMHSYPLWAWERSAVAGVRGASTHSTGEVRQPGSSRTTSRGGPLWVTNLPGVLRRPGAPEQVLDAHRIAGVVAYGSSYDGAPWWIGTHRITGWSDDGFRHARLRTFSAAPTMRELAVLHGTPHNIDARSAGELLVEITRAMGDRAGSDIVVPISGGKDSRLVLAAALAAGLPVRAVTGGAEDSHDFLVGKALADASGVPHLAISDAQATRSTAPIDTIRMVSDLSSGVVTAADAHFFPHSPSDLASTWLSGQGGEIARAFYGKARGPATAPTVLLKTLSRRPGRSMPLTARAEGEFASQAWARLRGIRSAGASWDALGDAYYATDRMSRHLGGALIHFELGLDYASPLWSRRLLPKLWAGTADQRQRSAFHDQVTLSLVSGQTAVTRRAFAVAVRGTGRKEIAVEPGGKANAALATAQVHLATRVARLAADDPLWNTLSRNRVVALSRRDPASLDFIERHHVWRVATVLHAWTEQSRDVPPPPPRLLTSSTPGSRAAAAAAASARRGA